MRNLLPGMCVAWIDHIEAKWALGLALVDLQVPQFDHQSGQA